MSDPIDALLEKRERRIQRQRRDREFVGSLEIVKDAQKIKNIRRAQGVANEEDLAAYDEGYQRAYGHSGALPGSTGTWKWDAAQQKLVKVSDEIPSGKLVTL